MTAAVLAGVVAASALGSVHCVAMCGPLVGLHGGARTLRLALVHSLGRLVTYAMLGAFAGLAGNALDLAGELGHVQRAATIVAGLAIVGVGVWSLVRRDGGPASAGHQRAFARGLVRIRSRRSATARAWGIGLLTGLLPCGWLWTFVIAAAGTGSVFGGALLMTAFWLGTVPAMVGVLSLAGPLLSRLRARLPAVTAVALIALGLGTLALRWRDAGVTQVEAPHCHQAGGS